MRILEPFEDHFWIFYNAQRLSVRQKIDYVLQMVMSLEQIPKKFFKHIEDGIYEIRIESNSDIFRLFSFFDDGRLIILLHGFAKKTQKLPRKEIERAKQLRKRYYENKQS